MDVNLIRDCIQKTVDINADTRRQAELDLRFVSQSLPTYCPFGLKLTAIQAEEQPGFLNALLNILQAEQDTSIRQSGTTRILIGLWSF